MSKKDAIEWFTLNYGATSVKPGETGKQAALRSSRELATAELEASSLGWFVDWEIDNDADITPTEDYFVSGNPQWQALLFDASGNVLEALGGIDFAEDYSGRNTPRSDPYARIVEAELASEALRTQSKDV